MSTEVTFELDQFAWLHPQLDATPEPEPFRCTVRLVGGAGHWRAPVDVAEQVADEAENHLYAWLRKHGPGTGDPATYATRGLGGLTQPAPGRSGRGEVFKQRRGTTRVGDGDWESLCRFRVKALASAISPETGVVE